MAFYSQNILVGWILCWLWFINVQYSANEQQSTATNHHINSSPSSAAYMGQCFGSALVQIMASRSMFTEPVKTLEHWLRHLDSGLGIDAIYLDFQNAFYSVPHQRPWGHELRGLWTSLQFDRIIPEKNISKTLSLIELNQTGPLLRAGSPREAYLGQSFLIFL